MGSRRQLKITGFVLSAILLVALVASFLPYGQVLAATTYYVAKTGNNSNPGTEAQPWLTIQKAANTMVAGDTVYVKQGTYNEIVTCGASGSSGNWISYKVYPGDTVTIDCSGLNPGDFGGFNIKDKSYILVDGFNIRDVSGDGGAGVNISSLTSAGCHYITIQNVSTYNTSHSGIWVGDWNNAGNRVTNITIDNCEVDHSNTNGSDESISLIMVNQFEVKNCVVHDTQGNKEGIDCKVGCTNGSIHHNECYNTGLGIYLDAAGEDETNIEIYANKLHNCPLALGLADEGGRGSLQDIYIYNNLIYDNSAAMWIWTGLYTRVGIYNNTFYSNYDHEIEIANDNDNWDDCYIANNIFRGDAYEPLIWFYSCTWNQVELLIDHNLFYCPSGYSGVNKYGTNYMTSNPLLVNPPSDFSLQSTSPAINAASATYAPDDDYIGTSRPQGAGYDIGAYEYTGDQTYPDWDVNADGKINVLDMIRIGQHWGETGQTGWIPEDVNNDGSVNVLDMILVGQHWTG
jgi:hypothetical protein